MKESVSKKLDWKDRKILKELDIDSRQTSSKISKKTNISKQIVNYRINKLLEKGIIKEFITYIDTQKLGYTFYDIFFKTKYLSEGDEGKIINEIRKMPEVGWLISLTGEWKFGVCVMCKNSIEFSSAIEKILQALGEKVISYEFFIVINAAQLAYKELYVPSEEKYSSPTYLGDKRIERLTSLDVEVLRILSNNARISKVELSKLAKTSLEKIRYSIKKMEKFELIQAYKPLIDVSKLGIHWHILLIQFNYCSQKSKEEFILFLKSMPETFYIVRGVGNWNLMVEFHTKNIEEFEKARSKINYKFEKIIRDERVMQILIEHKCTFFPGQISA